MVGVTNTVVDADAIPEELKERDQWLLWDRSADTPRRPHWKGDFSISWSNPDDWHSFEEAIEAAEQVETWGIGYVTALDNDDYPRGVYGVIDIDGGAIDRGEFKNWVPELDRFEDAGTYMEYSPSENGIHIPFVGEVPDWWTDGQFGDHEGVDVLTNKFCTFTGDTLEEAGSTIADIDPTPWLLKAYKAVHAEMPRLASGEDPDDASYDGDEWLTEDHVENALENLDPDVGYEQWRDIGFAVHDYDSGPAGRRLFEQWSKQGAKYDEEASRYIDAIWETADQGSGITVATLVHKAKQNGWIPGRGDRQAPDSEIDEDEVSRAERILSQQTSPKEPAGDLVCKNNAYGIQWVVRDDDGNIKDSGIDVVCNFALETLSFLQTDSGTDMVIRVIPRSPTEESYTVRVEPSVFNSVDEFKKEVVIGRTTWFDPNNRERVPTTSILRYLRETVGEQPAPHRTGTPHIGLSKDGSEFVTPDGSLTEDGWADDPEYEFYAKGGTSDELGALAQKWELTPEESTEFDEATVARISELLPQIRQSARGLPIMGWFYAAPLKAYIHEWEKEFPLLAAFGDTGTGKTSTVETYVKAFGGTGEPLSSTDTRFTIQKHLAESRGLPVWVDEYKPTEIPEGKLDHLHQRLKEVTKERSMPKGRPDLGVDMLEMRAPVIISGEQKLADPPVRRRSIMTNMAREPTRDGTPTKAAFGELTGVAYEDPNGNQHHPDGYDLREHARAYYRWMMQQSEEQIEQWWREARDEMKQYLDDFDVTLEESEQRGVQTVIFGTRVHREFATAHGASPDELPTETDLRQACQHIIENIGVDGHRREHADDWLELLTLAATEDYVEEGVHYRVVDSQSFGGEALAVHMPSAFTAVKKYLREYNLEDEYTVLKKTDYLDSFANKAEVAGEYVLDVNRRVNGLENGSKAVFFDPEQISEKLADDFNLSAFVDRPDEQTEDLDVPDGVTPVSHLDIGEMETITVELVQLYKNEKAWYEEEGWFQDDTGVVKLILRDDIEAELEEGKTYRLDNVAVQEDDQLTAVEPVPNVTTIEEIEPGEGLTDEDGFAEPFGTEPSADKSSDQESTADGETAADGGVTEVEPEGSPTPASSEEQDWAADGPPEDAVGPRANAQRLVKKAGKIKDEWKRAELIAQSQNFIRQIENPDEARAAIQRALDDGALARVDDDTLEVL